MLHLPVILFNQVIQVLVGSDERLSGQDAFGLQFGDGLMGRPTAVECDLLRDLVIAVSLWQNGVGTGFVMADAILILLANSKARLVRVLRWRCQRCHHASKNRGSRLFTINSCKPIRYPFQIDRSGSCQMLEMRLRSTNIT